MAKLVMYTRVSTQEQGNSGLGLEAQEVAIRKFAADNGHEIVEAYREVASGSLSVNERPILKAALAAAKNGCILIVNKVDRLARRASVVLGMMDAGIKFIISELGELVDVFFVQMLSVFAERERKIIGERTKAALTALKARGVKLGSPDLEKARGGASKTVCEAADSFAERMKPAIERMQKVGMSLNAIAREFNDNGTKTARGGEWTATTVKNLVARWA